MDPGALRWHHLSWLTPWRSAVTAGPDMPNRDLLTAAAADAVEHDRSPRS
jgi:hypothetical protein